MTIDYDALKRWQFPVQRMPYSAKDSILYALSVGYGADSLDAADLRFVYEQDQKVVPSLMTVLGAPGAWAADPRTGITRRMILHGEHRMTVHGGLRPAGRLRSDTRIARLIDKGPNRGALVVTERRITDEADGAMLATIEHTSFCRADGGLGRSDEPSPPLPATPSTPEDFVFTQPTPLSAALLYRLNGDLNPIHADPAAAKAVGFDRPILHGLCTFGIATRAELKTCCGDDPARLKSLGLRVSAPFYPGETLRVSLWRRGSTVHFNAYAAERHIAVLTHGVATVED